MLGVYASPRVPLAALFHIIFMLNLRVPPEVELVVGPSVFLNEYSTVKLFLRWPLPRLHTNNSRKQKSTTPRKVMQPIAVDTRIVVRSSVNLRKTRVLFRPVSLKSTAYKERLANRAGSTGCPLTVRVAKYVSLPPALLAMQMYVPLSVTCAYRISKVPLGKTVILLLLFEVIFLRWGEIQMMAGAGSPSARHRKDTN